MQNWQDEFAAEMPDERLAPAADEWDDHFDIDDGRADEVLAEIDRLQQRKANWGATILILIVSGFLFYLIARMQETFNRIQKEVLKATADEVRRDGKAIDSKVLDLYVKRSTPGEPGKGAQRFSDSVSLTQRIAERMGQLPLEKGKPKLGAERFSASGSVRIVGSRLRFEWMSFRQPDEGLPALAKWLCSAHGSDFKYRFTPIKGAADEEVDDID